MRQDAVQHRERLIEAAGRVFARDGYGAPLETVLAEAKLGRGTLYRHFRNRTELAIAVITQKLDEATALVDARIHSPSLFRDFLIWHGTAASLHEPALARLEDHDKRKLEAALIAIGNTAEALFLRVIEQARDLAVVRDDFGLAEFRLVTAMLIGSAKCCGGDAHPISVEKAVELLLEGLAPRTMVPWPPARITDRPLAYAGRHQDHMA